MAAYPIFRTVAEGLHPLAFQHPAAVQRCGSYAFFAQGGGNGCCQRVGRVHFRGQQYPLEILFLILRPQPGGDRRLPLGQRAGLVKDHYIGLVQTFQRQGILYPDVHIGSPAYAARQGKRSDQPQRTRACNDKNGNDRIERMRHSSHTAPEYPDKKHGNRRSRQDGKENPGYAVCTVPLFGQEAEHLAGEPHRYNQHRHFVVDIRVKPHPEPIVRKERIEQTEKESNGSAEGNQRIQPDAPRTKLLPGGRIESVSRKQQHKGRQRHLYFVDIGHLTAEDGKQRQQYGKRPRGGGLHLQAAVPAVPLFHLTVFHTTGMFRAVQFLRRTYVLQYIVHSI